MYTVDRLRWPGLACLLLLASCTQPPAAPSPYVPQPRADAVQDWNLVAQRIAATMQQNGMLPPPGPRVPVAPRPPYYLRVTAPGSTFLQAVATALETVILRDGGAVSRTPSDATVINLGVDVVKWGPRVRPPGGTGTVLGAATGAAFLVADAAPLTAGDAAALALGAGMAADLVNVMTPGTDVEAIWTASVVSADRVLFQLSEPLYVPPHDMPLYLSATRLPPLASMQPPPVVATRQIRFTP